MKWMNFSSVLAVSFVFALSVQSEIIFEDDFMGDNIDGIDVLNWQWWIAPDLVFADEADDVPEFGPGVMQMGQGTAHIGIEAEAARDLTDYRVTVLWVDRLIDGETDDADFHISVRNVLPIEGAGMGYEIEIDGDDNDAANMVPEDGPTSFHLGIRGGAAAVNNDGNTLAHATRDVVPRPIANVWYWSSLEIVGFTFRGKHWEHGTEEPDWQLEGEDLDQQFPSGGTHLGVWSGLVDVAFVRIETVEPGEVRVSNWSLH